MVLLIIHHEPAVRQALHTALTHRGFGPCLTAAGADEARTLHLTAGPAVGVIVTPAEMAAVVTEWRDHVGPVRVVFLVDGELEGWAARLPGELLLPSDPLPLDAVAGWVTALAAADFPTPPLPAIVAPSLPADPMAGLSASAAVDEESNPRHPLGPGTPPSAEPLAPVGEKPDAPDASESALLGDYQLLEILREDALTVTYRALQRSVHRVVVLERLRTSQAAQPEAVQGFRALVRAQAAVVHPQIASVYEAQEQDGRIFYTREWIEGKNLATLRHQRQRLTEETALDLFSAAAEAVSWLDSHRIPRRPVTPADVVLGRDGLPRVANLAAGVAPPFQDERAEIETLVSATQAVLDPGRPAEQWQALATRVHDRSGRGLNTWAEITPAVAEARRRAAESRPSHTRRLSAGTQEVVARRRWRRRRSLAVAAAAAAIVGMLALSWLPYWRAPQPRPLDTMVRVPSGSFIYQMGEMRDLPEFWMSKHEVTIAQYAEFLDTLSRLPGNRHDHPRQPSGKSSHRPVDWDRLWSAARKGGSWRGLPVDVNCPVTGVDYWDAWAYANWRGQRLPTEEEWEKAARSNDGRLYPWGREPDAPRANTGADFADGPNRGDQDGHFGWAPVDAFADTDVSPYGVVGMAGNVSEWTSSTMLHPEVLDQQVPVWRGGSYATRPMDLTQRRPAAGPDAADPTTGFRTAADRAP